MNERWSVRLRLYMIWRIVDWIRRGLHLFLRLWAQSIQKKKKSRMDLAQRTTNTCLILYYLATYVCRTKVFESLFVQPPPSHRLYWNEVISCKLVWYVL
jgi:hypothetical protein